MNRRLHRPPSLRRHLVVAAIITLAAIGLGFGWALASSPGAMWRYILPHWPYLALGAVTVAIVLGGFAGLAGFYIRHGYSQPPEGD